MEKLIQVIPESLKHLVVEYTDYLKIGENLYLTTQEQVIIAVIDSATDDTLVIYWSEEDQMYYHYTNCFGLGGGDVGGTMFAIKEWCVNYANIVDTD